MVVATAATGEFICLVILTLLFRITGRETSHPILYQDLWMTTLYALCIHVSMSVASIPDVETDPQELTGLQAIEAPSVPAPSPSREAAKLRVKGV